MRRTPEQKVTLVPRHHNSETVSDLCLETGIPRSTLYSWLKPHRATQVPDDSLVTPYTVSLLRKHIKKLKNPLAVLQTVNRCMPI